MKTLATVSVLEVSDVLDFNVVNFVSFEDNAEGNKAAKKLFLELAAESIGDQLDDDERALALDAGIWHGADKTVVLLHNTPFWLGRRIA